MLRPRQRRRIATQRVLPNLRADKIRRFVYHQRTREVSADDILLTGVNRPCKEGTGSVQKLNPVELRKGPWMVLNWLQTSGRVELVH